MNVLIACEESQRVCMEFRKKGHRAFSCDLIEPSGGVLEYHIKGNVLPLLNGRCIFETMDGGKHKVSKWHLIIAFPPCTKTSNAGARHLYKNGELNIQRYYEGMCGKAFFMAFFKADCEKICVENPTPSKVFEFPEPTQIIQPYQFGHPFSKRTQLWLKGLPKLVPTKIVEPERTWCPSGSYSGNHNDKHRGMFTTDRAKNRAKTFPGIAKAMADQWG